MKSKTNLIPSLNVFYFPIVFSCFFFIYKYMQSNTITCKQKGKRVEPQVLKLMYGSPLDTQVGVRNADRRFYLFN